jgi:hypothetical protein
MEETMTEIRNVGQEVQAEIMKRARKGQEVLVGAIRTWTETVHSIAPQLTPPHARRLSPFADRLPRPEELAANAYDFAQKLLANQRKFAEDMLHAAAPMLPGLGAVRKPGRPGRPIPSEPATAEKPGAAPKADAPSAVPAAHGATAAHKAASQKTGAAHRTGAPRKAAAARKAGPAAEKNGSTAR